ncbi:MAG TPA: hypothetical protein VFD26_04185 [Methyloceanibacter sp.]|nr:hypothetical protein [Methyloceanibacter sp.]
MRGSFAIGVLGAGMLLGTPAFAADPSDLESKLTNSVGGRETRSSPKP